MDQSRAEGFLTADEIGVLGAANELVWRAARLVSLSCEGLPLAGGTLDPEKSTRWQREKALRAELASNLGLRGSVFTYIPQPGQSWWTRVGYRTDANVPALLIVEVAGPTVAARTAMRAMAAHLRTVTSDGLWRDVQDGDGSQVVVRAALDDRGLGLDEAGTWIHERLDELIRAGLAPHRQVTDFAWQDPGLADRARLGGSAFSQMRGTKRRLTEHVRLMASLAVASTPAPLLREPRPQGALRGYPTLRHFDTSIGALGGLSHVEISVPGRRSVVCVEGKPGPGERSWTQLHDAITPADGKIWADLRLFMEQSGLVLPPVGNRVGTDGLTNAEKSLRRVAEILTSVIGASDSKSLRWTKSSSSDATKALLVMMLRVWAQTGRLLAWGTSGRDVYLEIGWVPRDGDLILQAGLSVDPKRRGLMESVLDRFGRGELEKRGWQLSDRSWTFVRVMTDGDHPAPASWLAGRVGELNRSGLLVPFNRWGMVPGESSPPMQVGSWPPGPDGGRQREHLLQVQASAVVATQPSADTVDERHLGN